MAIHIIDLLGGNTIPDTSGNVTLEPAAITQTNDRFAHLVWKFADTATKDKLGFVRRVPKNYVGTAAFILVWYTTVTTGNALWDIDYKAIADGESSDPSTDDEALTSGSVAVPGTALLYKYTSISATSANFSADDIIQGTIARDGVNESSGAAAGLYLVGAFFSFADA